MAAETRARLDNELPKIKRVITTHNDSGKAIFSSDINDELPFQELPDGARFSLAFATNTTPAKLNGDQDMRTYERYLENKPGVMIPNGTVCRIVDMMPGALSPMHRTVSLDYGVVLEGNGEKKLLRRGDVSVQRGTNHAWQNASKDKWARMLYVLQEAEPLVINGKPLDEDYGGMPGVKPSRVH
ncbi:hypothetical protein H2203_009127 [Taxawa tesnikishii (nom. ined.)]|nr:hypothetical protein H2203_009127 [Dothideales sp. JES 119]